jgi:hypothetical protein
MSESGDEPSGTEPDSTEPADTEPAGTEAEATEPDSSEPEAGEPDSTSPAAAAPVVRTPRRRGNRRGRRRPPSLRTRVLTAVLAAGALVAAAVAGWSVPEVRRQLLDSFTQRGASFTELYFTADPSFDGGTVVVPLAVTDHGTGSTSYQLKVTLESPDGSTAATDTVPLVPKDGTPVPAVVKLQSNGNVAQVRVALLGHTQTLHFRFGQQPTTAP